jgi:hypothetical protein
VTALPIILTMAIVFTYGDTYMTLEMHDELPEGWTGEGFSSPSGIYE